MNRTTPIDVIIEGEAIEEMRKLSSGCIDLTVTSPPYDNLRKYNGYTFNFEGIAKELFRVTKSGGVVVWVVGDATINGSETGTSFRQALEFKEVGFNLHDTMIYEKQNISFPEDTRYYNAFEYMFILSKGYPRVFNPLTKPNPLAGKTMHPTKRGKDGNLAKDSGWLLGKKRPERSVLRNVWSYSTGSNSSSDKIAFQHPAIFPESLAADHILSWSNPGDLILDPMCGSGTTCKMAKYHQRHFLGIDISGEYCEIARKRVAAVPARLDRWAEADA